MRKWMNYCDALLLYQNRQQDAEERSSKGLVSSQWFYEQVKKLNKGHNHLVYQLGFMSLK